VWPVIGGEFSAGFQLPFTVSAKEFFSKGFALPWADVANGAATTYSVSVITGGTFALSPSRIRISGHDTYYMQCELTIHDQSEFFNCVRVPVNIAALHAGERAAALQRSALTITDNYNTYNFYIFSKGRSRQNGETVYTLTGYTIGRLLDAPYALPITATYPAGMMADIVAGIASPHGVTLAWGLINEYLPENSLFANNETPLAVIRKLVDSQLGVLQSSPDGSMAAVLAFTKSVNQWENDAVDMYYSDLIDFFSDDDSDDLKDGFNCFLVSDHTTADDQVILSEKSISSTVKEIHAFVLPWTGDALPLSTSGPGRVAIAAPEIVEETIVAEQLEFISGAAKTSKPIYQIISVDYGDNTQLGAISDWSETGELEVEVKGQTLCKITYKTKYWKWQTIDTTSEAVQFWTRKVWGNTPVTIIVNFGDSAASSATVVVEPDDYLNVDSDGNVKSELAPEDLFNFLTQVDSTVKIDSITTSAGTINSNGSVTRYKTLQQVFTDTKQISLPTIPAGSVTPKWYGREPVLTLDGNQVSVNNCPAIAELSWQATMQSYSLTPPPMDLEGDEKYYIVVLVEVSSI